MKTLTTINRKEIMTNAWSLVKTANQTISEALKRAWAFAKGTVSSLIEQVKKSIPSITIESGNYKGNDQMTYKQMEFISTLGRSNEGWEGFPYNSGTQNMKHFSKSDASEIIDALKSGYAVKFN